MWEESVVEEEKCIVDGEEFVVEEEKYIVYGEASHGPVHPVTTVCFTVRTTITNVLIGIGEEVHLCLAFLIYHNIVRVVATASLETVSTT